MYSVYVGPRHLWHGQFDCDWKGSLCFLRSFHCQVYRYMLFFLHFFSQEKKVLQAAPDGKSGWYRARGCKQHVQVFCKIEVLVTTTLQAETFASSTTQTNPTDTSNTAPSTMTTIFTTSTTITSTASTRPGNCLLQRNFSLGLICSGLKHNYRISFKVRRSKDGLRRCILHTNKIRLNE